MSDLGKLLFFVTIGFFLNAYGVQKEGKDVTPVLVGNVFLFVALGVFGALFRYDVAKMLAALYLLASFLIRGVPLFQGVASFITSFVNTATPPTKVGGSQGNGSSGTSTVPNGGGGW